MNFDNELTYRNKRNGAVVYGGVPPKSPDEWEHVYVIPANDAILAVRPAPVWDEEDVTKAVARIIARRWGMSPRNRDVLDDARAVVAVVRDHPPAKPDREDMVEAMSAALHVTTDRIPGLNPGPVLSADCASVEVAADAVLDLLPGRSEATVKAEALNEAEAYTRTQERWLRGRAARLAAEGGADRG